MKPKVLLLPDDPALRLRLAPQFEGMEVRTIRDEHDARHVLDAWRVEDDSSGEDGPPWTRAGEIVPFEECERRILLNALISTGWNVKQAAQRLGIGRATLYRKIDRYDLRGRNAG
ncbi:MAG: helix-turn-helix domain-containing protein [Planctomycetota bacterium]|nr:helix-turn-helix domain-containing protein [Planctomycetota bacterium]